MGCVYINKVDWYQRECFLSGDCVWKLNIVSYECHVYVLTGAEYEWLIAQNWFWPIPSNARGPITIINTDIYTFHQKKATNALLCREEKRVMMYELNT